MAVKFIVDSSSDITQNEAKALGITCLPLTVSFGEEIYRDGVDLSHNEFYEKLIESDVFPKTSQLPPAEYEEAMEEALKDGSEVLVITVSSKVSGTYQSAVIAAESFGDKVTVIDSESVAVGIRILLERGLELASSGMSACEIAAVLNKEKYSVRVIATIDTLEYLKRGGRISSAAAIAGGVLNLKPVITVKDGELAILGKARGSKQANNFLRNYILECGGINFKKPFALAYSGLSDATLRKYISDSRDLWENETDDLPVYSIGCVIGAHAGPGAAAIAFFEN